METLRHMLVDALFVYVRGSLASFAFSAVKESWFSGFGCGKPPCKALSSHVVRFINFQHIGQFTKTL